MTPAFAATFKPAGLTPSQSSFRERSLALFETKWALDFAWEDILSFTEYMDTYNVKKGQVIFCEGSDEKYMCIIAEGRVNILKDDSERKNKVIATIEKGSVLGEMSLIDGGPRSATAVADDHVTLFLLSKERFDLLLEKMPALGVKLVLKIAKMLSLRLRQTSGTLVDFLKTS